MTLTITAYWLTFLISVALPAITALIAKRNASPTVKAVILLALSVITGWLTSLQATGGTFHVKDALIGVAVAFVTAVAAHFGLLKPTGITGSGGAIASAVPGGIGSDGADRGSGSASAAGDVHDQDYPYSAGAADKL